MTASNWLRRAATSTASRLVAAYRRTGADLPFGDPLPSHGSDMEGWFWRVTDSASGRVVVALCGVNRHAAGRLRCVVREDGRVVFDGTSALAGLELGSLPGLT